MTLHERKCALAAIGALIEKAQSRWELRQLRAWFREVLEAAIKA